MKRMTTREVAMLLSPDRFEHWQERAAIMEYDGGLSRTEAEDLAMRAIEESIGKPTQTGDTGR